MIQLHDKHVDQIEKLIQKLLLRSKPGTDDYNQAVINLNHISQARRGYSGDDSTGEIQVPIRG